MCTTYNKAIPFGIGFSMLGGWQRLGQEFCIGLLEGRVYAFLGRAIFITGMLRD